MDQQIVKRLAPLVDVAAERVSNLVCRRPVWRVRAATCSLEIHPAALRRWRRCRDSTPRQISAIVGQMEVQSPASLMPALRLRNEESGEAVE